MSGEPTSGAASGAVPAVPATVVPPAGATAVADGDAHRLITWAQNGEDIRLFRALRDVQRGHYVEVGGYHPEDDSATRLLYDHGWSGLVLEPVPALAEAFQQARPRDVVLPLAAGEHADSLPLYEMTGTGLLTVNATVHAGHIAARGSTGISVRTVAVRPLSEILTQFPLDPIHLLLIDAEGAEEHVLTGLDLSRHRPWIIVVEAIDPVTGQPAHEAWEPQLLAEGYHFAADDGLNRFYVEAAHAHRASPLQAPVTARDGFTPIAQERLAVLLAQHLGAVHDLERIARVAGQLRAEREHLETCLRVARAEVGM